MVRPKKETEDILFSITKKRERPIHQTHTKQKETLEFKLIKPRETFYFQPSINLGLDSNWMPGLTS